MSTKSITWEELAKHTTEETSVWIAVDDIVYDVTKFLDRHPGGREYLLLAAGRDCTDLFISYHPFSSTPRKVLEKYAIGTLVTRQYPRFKPDTGFYAELCKRVKLYFDENKLDHKAPFASIWRMSLMFSFYVISYITCFSSCIDVYTGADQSMFMWWTQRLVSSIILGWSQVMFLLHIMHDCSHSAVGHSEMWWIICGRMFSETLVGSSMVAWQNQHVVGHHIYTSVYSVDPDVPMAADHDIRLIIPQQNNNWIYQYQHIYLAFGYCLLAIKSRLQDFTVYFTRKNGPIDVNPVTTVQWCRLIFSKIFHFILRFVIPYYYFNMSMGLIIGLYIPAELVSGGYLAFNFQVSHVSDAAVIPVAKAIPASSSFPVNAQVDSSKNPGHVLDFNINTSVFSSKDLTASDVHKKGLKGVTEATQEELLWDCEWAHLQTNTSVDYAHDSPLCTFMCGALNYQTVHHLFPSVSQYLYPYIAPIVQQTCKDYNVRYNYIPTFAKAVEGHFAYLKKMSAKGLPVEMPKLA